MKVKDHIGDIVKIRAYQQLEWDWGICIDLTVDGVDYNDWFTHIDSHEVFEIVLDGWKIPPEMFWEMVLHALFRM